MFICMQMLWIIIFVVFAVTVHKLYFCVHKMLTLGITCNFKAHLMTLSLSLNINFVAQR